MTQIKLPIWYSQKKSPTDAWKYVGKIPKWQAPTCMFCEMYYFLIEII